MSNRERRYDEVINSNQADECFHYKEENDERDIRQCYENGANSYIVKPVSFSGFMDAIRRLIGENVEFLVVKEPALWQVKVDPNQIDQVLMNLVVNAKDVMPKGGKLTIETANADLSEDYFYEHGAKGTG